MLTRPFSQMGDSRCPIMGCVWECPRLPSWHILTDFCFTHTQSISAVLSEQHCMLSPTKKPWGNHLFNACLSAQCNSQYLRVGVGFCHSEWSGFNERNKPEKITPISAVFVTLYPEGTFLSVQGGPWPQLCGIEQLISAPRATNCF